MRSSLPPVLIVTGDTETVQPIVRFLDGRGIGTELIRNPSEVPTSRGADAPTLVLVDGGLPDDAAYALCRRLKQGEKTQTPPVILLLRAADEETREKAFEAGADDYLLTPIQQRELETRLASRMQGRAELLTLHFALDTAIDAAFLCNGEGNFVYVNEAACRSLGYGREELLKLNLAEIDPGYAAQKFDDDRQLVAGGTDIRMVFPSRHRRRDGSEFPVEISVSTFKVGSATLALCMARDITDRKAAEDKLYASEQAFRATVENSPDLISRYDRNCRRLYMNPAFLRHCLQPVEELLGKTPLESPVLLDPKGFMERLQQVIDTKEEIAEEIPVWDASGKLNWGHVRVIPEFDKNGEVVSVLSIGRDITSVKENENRFRILAESFPDLLMRFNGEARHTYVNPVVTDTFGLRAEEMIGRRPRELSIYGDQAARLEAAIGSAFSSGEAGKEEIRIHTTKGEQVYEMRFIPKRDSAKKLVGVLLIGRNVTQLHQTEMALRTSEREFRTLAANSPSIIVRYDRECRRTYVNPAFVRQSGYSEEELLAHSPKLWADTKDAQDGKSAAVQYTETLQKVMATGQPDEVQLYWANAKTGALVHYSLQVVPEYDGNGNVSGALSIGHDITALKAAERQLEESYKLLQELTSRRETAREEERKRMAREIHDELGQRLTALRLRIGLLRLQNEGGANINEVSKALIDMTDQTLKVVRDVSALLRPAALELGINPALEWLAEEFQRNTGIACALDLMVLKPLLTEAQATALFRCAQESLTNVARHSGAKEARVSLEDSDGNYVLEIEDNGLGFDMESPKVQRFGIAGIHERMLSVGGTATVESSPGKGTRVRVTLPIPELQEELTSRYIEDHASP